MYFPLGRVVSTRSALDTGVDLIALIERHTQQDWGELCKADKILNDAALRYGGRILSKYVVGEFSFYVITEHDRSATTVMLVADY